MSLAELLKSNFAASAISAVTPGHTLVVLAQDALICFEDYRLKPKSLKLQKWF